MNALECKMITYIKCVHWVLAQFSIQFEWKTMPIPIERTLE